MGTPQFSCPALQNLLNDKDFEVVAVYTREPQIAGRGQKVQNSPIHNLALQHNLKVFTPKTLRNVEAQKEFADLKADVTVVVAYGLILPQEILDGTKLGCINIHPSLLPRWRGAAPIQRPIMEGDSKTGITIIKMDKGLDSGDMIYKEEIDYRGDETYQEMADKLSILGAEILLRSLKDLRDQKVTFIKQDEALMTYAKKLEKAECEIDWNKSAQEISRKIRGLSGCLEAYFNFNGEKIKIFKAEIIDSESTKNSPGQILNDRMEIQCGKGVIRPLILQRQGKKPMPLKEFLLGFTVPVSQVL